MDRKRIAVTGRGGNLDTILVNMFNCIRIEADVLDKLELREEIYSINPDVIINCAAYTNVDDAELPVNRKQAMEVNSSGVCNIRDVFNGQFIQISTDYIFDGVNGPYTEDAEPHPIGYYGKTKWCGEQMVLEYPGKNDVIVRTTILYGGHKPDFANTVLKKLKLGFPVIVTNKIYGSPTHVFHLARGLMQLVKLHKPPRIVNIAGSDVINRYEFAYKLAEMFGYDTNRVVETDKITGIAQRPRKAGLKVDLAKELGIPIYNVDEGISQLFLEKAALYSKYPER